MKINRREAEARCRAYRRRILEISQKVTALHIAPAFSCIEIVDAVYHHLLRDRDIFIMSKGHGSIAQYVILESLGILTKADLDLYCQPGGILGAHPDYGAPGIHASTGSLGHGLGIAVGQAYGEKLKGTDVVVYCLLSDGEMQEGSTWEAILVATNLKLTNLVVYVDNNNYTGLAKISDDHPSLYPLAAKFQAFGWRAGVIDGHDSEAIVNEGLCRRYHPFASICHTVKGQGVSYMTDQVQWHYRSPSPKEYEQAMQELGG